MHEGPELVLTPAEREALRAWSAGRPDRGVRARIVLDAADGVSVSDSARALGVSRPTVASWRGRYAAQGLAGLEHRPRSGRPPRIDDADVITVTLAGPLPPRTAWSARGLADHLGVSHTALSAVWRRWGVTGDDPTSVTVPTSPPLPCAHPRLLGLWQQANAGALVLAEGAPPPPAPPGSEGSEGLGGAAGDPPGAPADATERLDHAATVTAAFGLLTPPPLPPVRHAAPRRPGAAGAGASHRPPGPHGPPGPPAAPPVAVPAEPAAAVSTEGRAAFTALLRDLRERHPDLDLRVLVWDPGSELPDAPLDLRAAPEYASWQGTAGVVAQLELRHRPDDARAVIDSVVAALRAHAAEPGGGHFAWQRPGATARAPVVPLQALGGLAGAPTRAPRAFDQLALGSFNEKLVIESIREAGALSRVEIAERTGLTPQAVSRITRNLLTSAFLVETPPDEDRHRTTGDGPTAKGKPRVPLRLRADAACAIGIHLDPEMVTQVLVDLCGGVVEQRRLPLLGRHDPDWVIDSVARMARETIEARRPATDELLGVGVAVPGPLDAEAGVVLNPPLFDSWRNVPLRAALAERLGVPVTVEKDATAAAIGERWIGAGERAGDFVYLYLGAGAGCGAFLNGDVYRGRTGNAGEFGQLCALAVGRLDPEGRPGLVPECAPMSSVVEKATAAGLAIPADIPPGPDGPGGAPASAYEHVCAAAVAGDERAAGAIRDVARVVARGAIGVTDLLDTTLLVVGGPAAPAPVAGLYLSEIRAAVNAYPVARHVRRVHVAHSLLNESAAAMGAASGVFHASFAPRLRTHARGLGPRAVSHGK
ncbi:ROK family protein [Streptomyces sp. B6B3]|uniref:ROK family protein n=1 Tax=Streptomyces sp. B6B3 TaxID=3153570 RepID=UPI00325F6FBA